MAQSLQTSPKFPTIPMPEPNVDALYQTVRELKRTVELLIDDNGSLSVSHVYVQPNPPASPRYRDFWIMTIGDMTLNLWNETEWLVLCHLPNVPAVFAKTQQGHVHSGKR